MHFYFLHPSGFDTNSPSSRCPAGLSSGHRQPGCSAASWGAGTSPRDAVSLPLSPAREEFAPWAVSSGLTPTTHCCPVTRRPHQAPLGLGRGEGLRLVLLLAVDSGIVASEHPTRTSPGREPVLPGGRLWICLQQCCLSFSAASLFCRETGFGFWVVSLHH